MCRSRFVAADHEKFVQDGKWPKKTVSNYHVAVFYRERTFSYSNHVVEYKKWQKIQTADLCELQGNRKCK